MFGQLAAFGLARPGAEAVSPHGTAASIAEDFGKLSNIFPDGFAIEIGPRAASETRRKASREFRASCDTNRDRAIALDRHRDTEREIAASGKISSRLKLYGNLSDAPKQHREVFDEIGEQIFVAEFEGQADVGRIEIELTQVVAIEQIVEFCGIEEAKLDQRLANGLVPALLFLQQRNGLILGEHFQLDREIGKGHVGAALFEVNDFNLSFAQVTPFNAERADARILLGRQLDRLMQRGIADHLFVYEKLSEKHLGHGYPSASENAGFQLSLASPNVRMQRHGSCTSGARPPGERPSMPWEQVATIQAAVDPSTPTARVKEGLFPSSLDVLLLHAGADSSGSPSDGFDMPQRLDEGFIEV